LKVVQRSGRRLEMVCPLEPTDKLEALAVVPQQHAMTVSDIRKGAHERVEKVVAGGISAADIMRNARDELTLASLLEGEGDGVLRRALTLNSLFKAAAYIITFSDSEEMKDGDRTLRKSLMNTYDEDDTVSYLHPLSMRILLFTVR